jgi:hypothetical protein
LNAGRLPQLAAAPLKVNGSKAAKGRFLPFSLSLRLNSRKKQSKDQIELYNVQSKQPKTPSSN